MNNINEKFDQYTKILTDWNARMNLVSRTTIPDIRNRHIADSAQIAGFLPSGAHIIDLGSGAGFPAVVLAIMGFDTVAIESITKKCNFLTAVKNELGLNNLTIINGRIENTVHRCSRQNPTVITARAFANLTKIFDLTWDLGLPYVLLKGENVDAEIADAKKQYRFNYKKIPSRTGPGFVLIITRES